MKKTFFTLTLIAFCACGALAQGISGGLKLGANFANQKVSVSGLGSGSADVRTSFHVGGYLNLSITEKFGIQPELLYNSLGSKSGDQVSKADYISIPVMLRYNPAAMFNVHAGPQFGFLMSAKSELDGESVDVKDGYKGLDLGLGLGAGVDLPMGLGITARYVFGLTNISEEVEDSGFDISVKNTVIQLSVTYKLFGE